MKKNALFVCFYLTSYLALAQTDPANLVPLVAEQWAFEPGKVKFVQEKGKPAMNILPGAGKVAAKNLDFADGTIEFDVKPKGLTFYFRYQNAQENECFYFRMGQAGDTIAPDAIQYAPVIDGVLMWDIYPHYQSNASFAKDEWNHVKLVIAGAQMRIFVNSNEQPTLEVEHLAGNPTQGTLAFEGDMIVSNLVVKPKVTEGVSPVAGIDPTGNDPRYIRRWAVSDPFPIPEKVDFSDELLPSPETTWRVLEAERRGLMNLTRTFGKNDARSIVWMKVSIRSTKAQSKRMNFGFVDDAWVFLNGQLVYLDKNWQGRLMEKAPGGRCSVENTSFVLPLKEGANELLIGLANDAYWGRGAVAQLEDTEGTEVVPDPTFDSRLVDLPEETINTYAGLYQLPTGQDIQVRREKKMLLLSGEGFVTIPLYPRAKSRFFSRENNMEVEFVEGEENEVASFVIYNDGKQLMEVVRIE